MYNLIVPREWRLKFLSFVHVLFIYSSPTKKCYVKLQKPNYLSAFEPFVKKNNLSRALHFYKHLQKGSHGNYPYGYMI